MNIKCIIGIHDWSNNCECCERCRATRSDKHSWRDCKCDKCGQVRSRGHKWSGKTCSRCGAEMSPHETCNTPSGSSIESAGKAYDILLSEALPVLPTVSETTIRNYAAFADDASLRYATPLSADQFKTRICNIIEDMRQHSDFGWFEVSVRPKFDCAEVIAIRDRATRRSRLVLWKTDTGFSCATSDYREPWRCEKCLDGPQCGECITEWPY